MVDRAAPIREVEASVRTCVICREKAAKETLARYALVGGELMLDVGQRIQARGVYAHAEHDLEDPKIRTRLVRSLNKGMSDGRNARRD